MSLDHDDDHPHTSTADKLVRMANQIATFFHSQTNEDGPRSVATHINNFWEPRMRRQFLDLAQSGAPGLDPMVMAAVPLIKPPAAIGGATEPLPVISG